jgi:hypothetical protein
MVATPLPLTPINTADSHGWIGTETVKTLQLGKPLMREFLLPHAASLDAVGQWPVWLRGPTED